MWVQCRTGLPWAPGEDLASFVILFRIYIQANCLCPFIGQGRTGLPCDLSLGDSSYFALHIKDGVYFLLSFSKCFSRPLENIHI